MKQIILFITFCLVSSNIINAQWRQQNNDNTTQTFINITYANKDIAWGLTNDSKIFRSENAQDFIEVTRFTLNITSMAVIDTNSIFVVENNVLWKTDNACKNWKIINIVDTNGDSAISISQIHFFNNSQGFLMGNPNNGCVEIWTTSDGGNLWEKVPCNMINFKLNYISPNTSFFSQNGKVMMSQFGPTAINNTLIVGSDYGKKWDEIVLPKNLDLYQIAFKDSLNGMATRGVFSFPFQYHDNNIAITKDGGNTWDTTYKTKNPKAIFAITYAISSNNEKSFYIVGARRPPGDNVSNNLGTDVSFDNGKNWYVLDDKIEHRLLSFYDTKRGISNSIKIDTNGVTQLSVYFFTGIPDGITGVKKDYQIAKNLSVYPNPFNTNLNLSFTENTVLNIYNIQGILLRKIDVQKGNNMIDLSDLVSGTYFLVIKSNNEIFHSTIIKQE